MDRESLIVNVGVAVVFYVLGGLSMRRWLRRHPVVINARCDDGEACPMETTKTLRARVGSKLASLFRDKVGLTILVFLIASALLGVQAVQYQNAQSAYRLSKQRVDWKQGRDNVASDARVKCTEQWGRDLIDTVKTRAKAGKARNDALDNIVLTIVAARRIPPQADETDFAHALTRYVNAVRANRNAQAANPYSKLKCDDEVAAAVAEYEADNPEPGGSDEEE